MLAATRSQHVRKSTFPETCLSVVRKVGKYFCLDSSNVSSYSCQPHLYLLSKQTVVFGKAAPAPPPSTTERLSSATHPFTGMISCSPHPSRQNGPAKRRKSPRRLPRAPSPSRRNVSDQSRLTRRGILFHLRQNEKLNISGGAKGAGGQGRGGAGRQSTHQPHWRGLFDKRRDNQ